MINLSEITINKKDCFKKMYKDYILDLKSYKSFYKTFNINFLDLYFSEENLNPYFILNNNIIIGFLLVQKNIIVDGISINYYISDLYISKKFRNKNFAIYTIELFFKLNKGTYLIGQLIDNIVAINFWNKVYLKYNIEYIEFNSIMNGDQGIFQYFSI